MMKLSLGKRSFLPLATLMGFIGIADTAFMLPVISAYAKFLGVATAAPISGLILETVGPQMPYLIGALVQVLALIIVLLSLRNYVKLPKQTI